MKAVEKRRDQVLKWKKSFLDEERQIIYREYLGSPGKGLFERKKESLSRFYWGAVSFKPKPELTGVETVRRLRIGLLEKSQENEKEVRKLATLTDFETQEHFHDFRKRVRSVLKILKLFPEIKPNSDFGTNAITLLDEMVERYGKVNDRITTLRQAKEDGKKKRVEELENQLDKDWAELLEWHRTSNIDSALKILRWSLESP